MKKLLALLLCITVFTCSSGSLVFAEEEYVFTEAQLRTFLEENIREAVDKVTADLVRDCEIKTVELNRDHDIEKALLAQQIEEQTSRANSFEKELKFSGFKLVVGVCLAGAAGLGIGYMVGNLF